MKRLITLVLALSLALGLTACSGNSDGGSTSSTGSTASTASTTGGDEGDTGSTGGDTGSTGYQMGGFDDVITITADSDVEPFQWDSSTDTMAKYIEDNFGIAFQQTETNFYNNDFTVLQLAAVDGSLPKVFAADILYYTEEITQFIPEELVAEIPEDLLAKYPLTKQLLENDAVAQTVKGMYDGYYFLPKPDSADPSIYKAERKGMFIRKDWLEKVNKDLPLSWEELYDVSHSFRHEDPDGNGQQDTYGLTGDGMGTLRYFFSSTGISNRYWNKAADGSYFYGALDDSNIEVLEWLRKMWEDGSIDPDFGATTWETGLQKFSSNTFGICLRNADADWINGVATKYYGPANPDVNPFDRIDMIPALSLKKGETPRMEGYTSCMVATMFGPDITEEEMDRFLNYYEFLLSDEGKYMRMGIEGEDYTVENGVIKKVRDANGVAVDLTKKYPCIAVTHWPSWGFELAAYENVEYFDEYNDETKALNTKACSIRNQDPVWPEINPMLVDDTTVTDAKAFAINAEYWTIITGTQPVADMFADMKSRAMSSGYEAATKRINEIAAEQNW